MEHTSCMLVKQLYTLACAQAYARTRARTHSRSQICNIYCFSTATMIPECASVLGYMHIACKCHPRTGHENPERAYRYSSILCLTSALDRVDG